ncbi:MAG: ABC transporter permease subunit [Verrucomicrobiae bacterium]|nr:ABC transporter permease subunit [Verrucomicrobiae bacterium]
MSHFEIYQHPSQEHRAIRRGFSPVAAVLSWIWLYRQGLWVEGSTALLANGLGLLLLHLGGAPTPAGVAFQAALGLVIGGLARRFRELSAERSGFAYVCTIPARNGPAALAKLAAAGGVPLTEWRARRMWVVPDLVPRDLRGLAAVAQLTLRAAFRFRLVVVLLLLLLAVVIALPVVIKHDGSAQGFTQILITYTLTSITALLGFVTLWLACGTLARDVEDATLQLVCAKPIPRWQVWLGKWLGITLLNLAFLVVTGASLYVLLYWKASGLPEREQMILREEVLVARGVAREPIHDYEQEAEKLTQERLRQDTAAQLDPKFIREQFRQTLRAQDQVVPTDSYRVWQIPFGSRAARLADKPLQIRVKFYSPDMAGSSTPHQFGWEIGSEGRTPLRIQNSFAAESASTFPIGTNLIGANGMLTIVGYNLNPRPVLFPLEDGLEVLYPVGGFGPNFVRGLSIILFWLALLAAIGLFAASKLQFSVAAFVSFSILVVGLSSGTLKQVVEQRGIVGIDSETGMVAEESMVNRASVAVYGSVRRLIELVTGYNPVDALSTGRNITWGHLARAAFLVVGVAGGLFGGAGIWIFTRRELAAPI